MKHDSKSLSLLTKLKTFKDNNCLKETLDPSGMNKLKDPYCKLNTFVKLFNLYIISFIVTKKEVVITSNSYIRAKTSLTILKWGKPVLF